jgi:hypothetical protein
MKNCSKIKKRKNERNHFLYPFPFTELLFFIIFKLKIWYYSKLYIVFDLLCKIFLNYM